MWAVISWRLAFNLVAIACQSVEVRCSDITAARWAVPSTAACPAAIRTALKVSSRAFNSAICARMSARVSTA